MINKSLVISDQNLISYTIAFLFALIFACSLLFNPLSALILMLASALVMWAYLDIKSFIFVLLVFKPLIDLTWNGPSIQIMDSELNIQGALAVITLIILGIYILIIDRPKISSPLVWLFAFVGVNCISLLSGTLNGIALKDFLRVISAVPFLIVGRHIFGNRQKVIRFGLIFLTILLVPYTIAIVQKLGYIGWGYQTYIEGQATFRATGGYMHPFDIYKYVFLAVPLIFLILSEHKSFKIKIFGVLNLFLTGVIISFTLLRMAIFSFIFQNSLWFWLKKRFLIGIIVILIPVVLSFTIFNVGTLFKEHIEVLLEKGDMVNIFNWRGATWMAYMDFYRSGSVFQQLFGYGLYSDTKEYQHKYLYTEKPSLNDAHNDYLRILVENGILGLLCYFIFIIKLFFSIPRESDTSFSYNYSIFAKIVLITFLIMGITVRPTEEVTSFWYLLAVFSPFVIKSSPQ